MSAEHSVQLQYEAYTHQKPKPKSSVRITLCFWCNCKAQVAGMGTALDDIVTLAIYHLCIHLSSVGSSLLRTQILCVLKLNGKN